MDWTKGRYVVLVAIMILLCIHSTNAELHCTDPQKGFYMSYNALSKRDGMTDLFVLINSNMPKFNASYNDGKGTQYMISNLVPQLYYNQHHQKQIFLDPQHVNVTLGDVTLVLRFDYNITTSRGNNQSGSGRAQVLLDQTSYFIKQLLIKDGYLQWDPVQYTLLAVTFPISIEHSEPMLQYDHKLNIQLILNDHIGDRKLKTQIMTACNDHYLVNLKEHLNKQDIISNLKITYTYKNIKIDFLNAVKNYTLSNNQVKGLQAFFFFEAENKTFNCTPDRINFNQADYGGLQEVYSISSFREALKTALEQGLMDVKLDKKFQVPEFQFYMGDLANAVSYAQNFPADDPFDVSCKWSGNRSQVDLRSFAQHELYANLSVLCTIAHKAKDVLEVRVQIGYIVRVYGQDDSLIFYISSANIFAPQFRSLDPNYKISNPLLARYSVQRVVLGLAKTTTFGTGFKTSKRRFPSTHVNGDYIIVFDPSEL